MEGLFCEMLLSSQKTCKKMIEYAWFLTPTSPFIEANSVPYLLTIWGSSPENWFRIEHLSFILGWIGYIVWFGRKNPHLAFYSPLGGVTSAILDGIIVIIDFSKSSMKSGGCKKAIIIVVRYVRMWSWCESIDIWSGKTHPLIMDAFFTPELR